MVAMQALARQEISPPLAAPVTARPPCPNCGRPMHLALVAPGAGSSGQRIYCCGECGLRFPSALAGKDCEIAQ